MIEIDGSIGEAGGQILRTACALSAVTKKPCHVFNIRKGRPRSGLRHQHLLGIQALAQLCNGKLEGDSLSSEEIKFYPGEIYRDKISINIPTAGSITLALQTLIPPALSAHSANSGQVPHPITISFRGGATDTFFSPTIDYLQYVFLEILEEMGGKAEINILKKGYYPEGGAKVKVKIHPLQTFAPQNLRGQATKLKPLNLTERGNLKKILAISGASEFLKPKKVAERQLAGVREILGKLKLPIEERVEYYQTQCPGSQICLVVEFENTVIGTDNLGKLGKRAEDVGKEAALELLKEQKSNACLDKHLADQILPYVALAKGKSKVTVSEITNHCKANIWVIEKFIGGEFEIKENLITWIPAT
ncbi:MAG: RNA 3'-terminal phosphate cyclase [Candidatus Paceibacterales bacterium]